MFGVGVFSVCVHARAGTVQRANALPVEVANRVALSAMRIDALMECGIARSVG